MESPSTFEGQAFHPELPDGRGPGVLHAESKGLRFVPSEASTPPIELPYQGLALSLGGISDSMLLFTHPDSPQVTVFTSDHGILAHPALSSQASMAAQVTSVRRSQRKLQVSFFGCLSLALVAVLGLVMALGPLLGWVTDRVPPQLEIEIGDAVFSQMQGQVLRDDALQSDLERLVAPLLDAIPETGYPLQVHIVDDVSVNAFALPGGHIVLHSGLILAAETPEEVLGVLGHEVAHVTQRHSLRQIVDSAGLYVIVQTLLGDISGLAGVLVDGSSQVLELSFSRDHELEADSVGWDYLLAADIDPRGMIAFFETLEEETGGSLDSTLSFFSTHPASAERAELLGLELAALEARDFLELEVDFAAFQERLREISELE